MTPLNRITQFSTCTKHSLSHQRISNIFRWDSTSETSLDSPTRQWRRYNEILMRSGICGETLYYGLWKCDYWFHWESGSVDVQTWSEFSFIWWSHCWDDLDRKRYFFLMAVPNDWSLSRLIFIGLKHGRYPFFTLQFTVLMVQPFLFLSPQKSHSI